MDFNSWNIFWSLCFGSVATVIVVGNIFTIWTFFKLRRRKRAFIALISLAVADLLVGMLTIPLYITQMCMWKTLSASERHMWFFIVTGADIYTGITSIYTLAVISLERMFAVGWPLRHRTLNFRVYIGAVVIPWIVAAIFTSLAVLTYLGFIGSGTFLYLVVVFPATPLSVTCVSYYIVWKKQKSPLRQQNHARREVKLAKTLVLITGCSLSTWLPFQILNLLLGFEVIKNFSYLQLAIFITKLLHFSNSLINVIIYPFRIPQFKDSLLRIFRCCVAPFQRLTLR